MQAFCKPYLVFLFNTSTESETALCDALEQSISDTLIYKK